MSICGVMTKSVIVIYSVKPLKKKIGLYELTWKDKYDLL